SFHRSSARPASGPRDLDLRLRELAQRLVQAGHRAVDVVQLVEPEEAEPEGAEVCRLVTLQRHPGRGLQAYAEELPAGADVGVVGVAHHDSGRFVAGRRHARKTPAGKQRAYRVAERLLFGAHLVEAVALRLEHRVAYPAQRVGGHGGVIGVAAAL